MKPSRQYHIILHFFFFPFHYKRTKRFTQSRVYKMSYFWLHQVKNIFVISIILQSFPYHTMVSVSKVSWVFLWKKSNELRVDGLIYLNFSGDSQDQCSSRWFARPMSFLSSRTSWTWITFTTKSVEHLQTISNIVFLLTILSSMVPIGTPKISNMLYIRKEGLSLSIHKI